MAKKNDDRMTNLLALFQGSDGQLVSIGAVNSRIRPDDPAQVTQGNRDTVIYRLKKLLPDGYRIIAHHGRGYTYEEIPNVSTRPA